MDLLMRGSQLLIYRLLGFEAKRILKLNFNINETTVTSNINYYLH